MSKRRTPNPIRDAVKSARRIEREIDRAEGRLGRRRKAGQHDGLTKAGANRDACRRKAKGGWD